MLRKRGRKRSGGVLRKRRCASGGEENERAGKDEAGLEVRWGMRLNYREHPRFLQTTQGVLSQDQGSKGRTGSLKMRWENGEGIVQVEKELERPAMLFIS